jgi:hypothetical protein
LSGRQGTARHTPAFSRHPSPEFCKSFAPQKFRGRTRPSREGAGKTGCALHPRSHVQRQTKNAHEQQVQRKHSGLPCAMVLRLTSCSPRRDLACLSPSPSRSLLLENLTPTTGASGPRDFAVRIGAVRPRQKRATPPRPPHPMPSVQDDHDTFL